MFKILVVCTANICRSPLAEAVLRATMQHRGVAGRFEIQSAGTHAGHNGEKPDPRAIMAAARRGYHDLDRIRSRLIRSADFEHFDLILAMDRGNLSKLKRVCPQALSHKLRLYLEFSDDAGILEVPDPYFGSQEGFEHVLDLCEAGAPGIIDAGLRVEPPERLAPQAP